MAQLQVATPTSSRRRSLHSGSKLSANSSKRRQSRPLSCAESSTKKDSTSCSVPLNIHGLKSRISIPAFFRCGRTRLTKDVFPEPQGPKTPVTTPSEASSERSCSENDSASFALPRTSLLGIPNRGIHPNCHGPLTTTSRAGGMSSAGGPGHRRGNVKLVDSFRIRRPMRRSPATSLRMFGFYHALLRFSEKRRLLPNDPHLFASAPSSRKKSLLSLEIVTRIRCFTDNNSVPVLERSRSAALTLETTTPAQIHLSIVFVLAKDEE